MILSPAPAAANAPTLPDFLSASRRSPERSIRWVGTRSDEGPARSNPGRQLALANRSYGQSGQLQPVRETIDRDMYQTRSGPRPGVTPHHSHRFNGWGRHALRDRNDQSLLQPLQVSVRGSGRSLSSAVRRPTTAADQMDVGVAGWKNESRSPSIAQSR